MRRSRDETLSPEIERELEAVDRALAGEGVDAELAELATLAAELRAERPMPREDYAAELDQRVKRGSARTRGVRATGAIVARARGRLPSFRPRRALAPAGGLVTLLIALVVGVSVLGDDRDGPDGETMLAAPERQADPDERQAEAADRARREAGDDPAAGTGQLERGAPLIQEPSLPRPEPDLVLPLPRSDRVAPGVERRRQDRGAFLTLATHPDDVRDVSDRVIAITRSLDGVVVSSEVRSGDSGASATLQLAIPTRNLDAALDRLTELANVESMSERALDITQPFVSARDRLRDARAERSELLEALGNVEDEAEAEALRRQLADARREISRREAAFERVARRARLADLTVNVNGDPDASSSWTLADALDDALTVLRTTAGVLLVTAAVIVPVGLLIAFVWLLTARIRKARRERALDAEQ